ncbi:MAG TPA: hypothetical protein VFM18_18440 [Methanosarcina sp.]|nr:hypothetical protein [Methanosarcina sp.]
MKYDTRRGKIPLDKIPFVVEFKKPSDRSLYAEINCDLETCEGLTLLLKGSNKTTLSAYFASESDALLFTLKWAGLK